MQAVASRPLRLVGALPFMLLVALTACGGDTPTAEAPIDRDTFVATYVDLRLSALGSQTGVISDSERSRVLQKHGVTEEDLLGFADAWGPDPEAMRGVWQDVERRLKAAAGEDTTTLDEAGS